MNASVCLLQKNVYSRKRQLDQCKAQMKWNKQALDAWLEEAARKDEDALLIEKYSTLDDSNIKAMLTVHRYFH